MRACVFLVALAWAVPSLAAKPVAVPPPPPKPEAVAKALAATQPTPSANASTVPGSCCGGGSGKGCDANKAKGLNPYASEENWREFVSRVCSEPDPNPPEPQDPDPFAFSTFRGVRLEPMGTQTLINGARMAIASIIVDEPPHVVLKYYRDALAKAGNALIFGQVEEVPGMTYVSFRPEGSKNLKTITLVPHGEGTVILASVGNPEELIEGRPSLPEDVPLPPNSELPTAIQQLEPGLASRSAVFVVRDSTVENVQAFYRQELLRRGFTPVTVQDALPGMESYQKGNMLLSLTAKPHSEPSTVAVGMLWLDQ